MSKTPITDQWHESFSGYDGSFRVALDEGRRHGRMLECKLAAITAERDSESRWAEHYHREAEKYRTALSDLVPYAEADYYPDCATPGFKSAMEQAKLLLAPAEPVKLCGECALIDQDDCPQWAGPEAKDTEACDDFVDKEDAAEQERMRTGHA